MGDINFNLNKRFILLSFSVNHSHELALLGPNIFQKGHRGELFHVFGVEFSVRKEQEIEFFEGVEVREVPRFLLLFLFLIIIIIFLAFLPQCLLLLVIFFKQLQINESIALLAPLDQCREVFGRII